MPTNLSAGVQAFTSNVFLVTGDRDVVVDAGANYDVVAAVRDHGVTPDAVVITHPHPDHVGNLDALVDAFDPTVLGFDGVADADRTLADGDEVRLGDDDYVVLHTPGHEPHHVCLYSPAAGVLFSADLVFANGSFGRTDLDGGDRETLVESIDRLADTVAGEELTAMYPGHGPSVTSDPAADIDLAARSARFQ
ncbi:MBL fold metallo-hydrolase [Halobacterium salinarum]|uniref:MBL fold metallo-hydrolase n=1 Tax=Halobacterium salinarum TaxID=2242 RepID=UPI001F1EDB0F|nr:MBL fold metallo-hydrolase [Halobacterium salinarum]MCF2207040.1 MBL fold metallo-hydrolase [Halobacterium salinarum]MDL0125746.1 MBL fold metallo-hydrolase [Halobacterium salinarum]